MSEFIPIDGLAVDTTNLAVLVRIEGRRDPISGRSSSREVWIPRSVLEDGNDVLSGDKDLWVKEWFAVKEGLDA